MPQISCQFERDIREERRVNVGQNEARDTDINEVEAVRLRLTFLLLSCLGSETNEYLAAWSTKLLGGCPLPVVKPLSKLMKLPMTRFTMARATPEPIAATMPTDSSA